jgi:phytoene synthase
LPDVRDRDLVRLHWPPALRPAFDALLALDDRLAEVALGASQPALGAIKLAWWRDSLTALDKAAPPAEPLLRRVAAELLPAGLTGEVLADLPEAWAMLLEEGEDPDHRGRVLFGLLGRLLGAQVAGGGAFARADLARRTGEERWLEPRQVRGRAPAAVRPVTMLDALGRRDAARPWPPEPEATPGRSWTLLRHRLTGR